MSIFRNSRQECCSIILYETQLSFQFGPGGRGDSPHKYHFVTHLSQVFTNNISDNTILNEYLIISLTNYLNMLV